MVSLKSLAWLGIFVMLIVSVVLLERDRAAGGADCVIVVDSASDNVANDNLVTLREAVLFANGTSNPMGGETDNVTCPDPGPSTTDQVVFDETVFASPPPVINIGSSIELTNSGDAVSGSNGLTDLIPIDGGSNSFDCLRIVDASGVTISGLSVRHCLAGIHVTSNSVIREGVVSAGGPATGNLIADNYLGANTTGIKLSGTGTTGNIVRYNFVGFTEGDPSTPDPNGVGIHVLNAPGNTIGGTGLFRGVHPAGKPFPLSNRISGNTGPGILIEGAGASGNVIIDNAIGTAPDGGTAGNANGGAGIQIQDAGDTLIGGVLGDDTNIISGNAGYGIDVCCFGANQTIIQGNLIGVNHNADVAIPNGGGVRFSQANLALIGGSPAERNIISGNNGPGVRIDDGANGIEAHHNYIGTGSSGNTAVPNSQGVVILDSTATELLDNVISGNDGPGVSVIGANAENGVFFRNLVGVGANGSTAIGNGAAGMAFHGTGPNQIGMSAADGNIIAYNGGPGIEIVPDFPVSTRKWIEGNSIHSNGGLGIDLAADGISGDGVTPNDDGDGDFGGNELQNYPVLTSAEDGGSELLINGTLNSSPATAFTLEFFVNSKCDPSGFGEGETPAHGTFGVVTDANGDAEFALTVPADFSPGDFITATATDPDGNTSEFSGCVEVTEPVATPTPTPGPTGTPTPTPGPTGTETPAPTPSSTPGKGGLLGDTDCDEDIDSVDSLWVLREVAGLSLDAKCMAEGDVQCDGDRDSVDALGIQRHVAALPQISQTQPCRDIGT